MVDFNPDEYLATPKHEDFNPDEYLAEPDSEMMSGIKDFSREAVKALPVVGSVVGGALAGGPTFGLAALGGSALGAGAGKAAQTLIEENFLNEPKKSLQEKFTEIPKEVAYDVAGNITGEKLVKPLAEMAGAGMKKVASSLSGIPEDVISTLSKNYKEVGAIDDVALEADRIRQAAQDSINKFKNVQNSRISKAIGEKADLPVDISKTRQALVDNMNKMNPEINPEVVNKIRKEVDLIDNLSNQIAGDGGKIEIPAKDAYQLQKRLQDLAEYLQPGQLFKKKDFADLTFMKAAANTRQSLQRIVPEISQANAELSKIHRVGKNINKNLIVPEKPMNAMMSVGSGQNPMMQKQVEKLGGITGEDYLSPMQNLAAAGKFNNPDIISALSTGRAGLPLMVGSAMAGGAGGGLKGAALGLSTGLMSTPIGIKSSIGAGRALGKMGVTPSRLASESLQFYGPEIEQAIRDQIPEPPPMNPYQIDQKLKHDSSMTPSHKAKARLQNNKMNK